jgi:hypothetical protein
MHALEVITNHPQVRGQLMRQNEYAAISFECFWSKSIRLFANSEMSAKNSKGDLIVASLGPNSKANCTLACAISRSFA